MAAVDGALAPEQPSATNNRPLATKRLGTSVAGAMRRAILELMPTRTSEQTDVAISIAGRAVKSSDVRNRASRVAFPLMNWAVTAAAHNIAVNIVIWT